MDARRLRRSPLAMIAIAALLVGAQAASAQAINRCRIDGRLVLQSAPCPLERALQATAPAAPSTTPAAGAKKKTLADLLRERDGDARPAPLREAQGDGAHILRARMGAV